MSKRKFQPVVSFYFTPDNKMSFNAGRLVRVSYGYELESINPKQLVLKMNLVDAETRLAGHLGRTNPSYTDKDIINLQLAIDTITKRLNANRDKLIGTTNIDLN